MNKLIDSLVEQGLAKTRDDATTMVVQYARIVLGIPTVDTRIRILSDACLTLKSRLASPNAPLSR